MVLKLSKPRSKTIRIKDFILSEIDEHESDIVAHTAQKFGMSRQAAYKHVKELIWGNVLTKSGSRKTPVYALKETQLAYAQFSISRELAEDLVWTNEIEPKLPKLPENVFGIAHF